MTWCAPMIVTVAAILYLLASFGVNGAYAYSLGDGVLAHALFYLAISLGSGGFKIAIPVYLGMPHWSRVDRVGLSALFACCCLIDVGSGLGYAAQTRGAVMAAASSSDDATAFIARSLADADARLKALPVPRASAGQISAELKLSRDKAGPCADARARARPECQAVTRLEVDAAAALAYDAALQAVADARASAPRASAGGRGDLQAGQVAAMLLSVGVYVSQSTVSLWLGALFVVALELGCIWGFRLIVSPRPGAATVSAPSHTGAALALPPGNHAGVVIGADGSVSGSRRDLAAALGMSAPTLQKHLAALHSSGAAIVSSGARGTTVTLP